MTTLNEEIESEGPAAGSASAIQQEPEVIQRRSIDLSFLRAQTGPGEIEDYIQHPLNFNGSRGMAQMIRGATGMIGELRYAVLDLALGFMNFTKERKGPPSGPPAVQS